MSFIQRYPLFRVSFSRGSGGEKREEGGRGEGRRVGRRKEMVGTRWRREGIN